MKENVERVRLTRGKRINYQEQRRQSIKYSKTLRDSNEETEMRENKASKILDAKKDSPVMSVIALLDWITNKPSIFIMENSATSNFILPWYFKKSFPEIEHPSFPPNKDYENLCFARSQSVRIIMGML